MLEFYSPAGHQFEGIAALVEPAAPATMRISAKATGRHVLADFTFFRIIARKVCRISGSWFVFTTSTETIRGDEHENPVEPVCSGQHWHWASHLQSTVQRRLCPQKAGISKRTVSTITMKFTVRAQASHCFSFMADLARSTCSNRSWSGPTRGRQVIGVDLQGHGRTGLGARPISLEAMGDDMATILKSLGHDQADVLGYSFGGGVAFRLAVQHPEVVSRLALVSAGYAQDGFYPEMIKMQATMNADMADMMKDTPMYKSYAAVAPEAGGHFPAPLIGAMGDFMRKPYDYSKDVAKLKMPVMLVFADSDMYRPEHEIKFYQLLGGGLRDAGLDA